MAPQFAFCAEKKRLLDVYLSASHDVLDLQAQEAEEIAKGGEGLERFDLALQEARRQRDAAVRACMSHIAEHGC